MINSKENPEEWNQLVSELEDAHEHLGNLIKEMEENGSIDIEGYAVDIAHVYAHINRAWNSREFEGQMSDAEWEEKGSFPRDLEPLA